MYRLNGSLYALPTCFEALDGTLYLPRQGLQFVHVRDEHLHFGALLTVGSSCDCRHRDGVTVNPRCYIWGKNMWYGLELSGPRAHDYVASI